MKVFKNEEGTIMTKNKNENLMPIELVNANKTREQRIKDASNAGKKSGEVRRAKKTLRQELELLLELVDKKGKTNQEKMSVGLLKKAMKGNVKAFEMIRDTIGQKPKEKISFEVNDEISKNIEKYINGKRKN